MTFEGPPETLDGVARELIVGVYNLEGKLLLDTDRALVNGRAVELLRHDWQVAIDGYCEGMVTFLG